MALFQSDMLLLRKVPYLFQLILAFSIIGATVLAFLWNIAANKAIIRSVIAIRTGSPFEQSVDVRMNLREFESAKWYGVSRKTPTQTTPTFPPQMTFVKVCSMCNTSYWMAFPTNLTLKHYYFAGENGISIEMKRGIWDTAETRLANAVLSFGCRSGKSPAVMVDVGMHTGYFSGMALAAGCRVVAFEPTKYHHPYALMTAMLSGYEERFTLHKLAASNKTGDRIPFNDWSISDSEKSQQNGQTLAHVYTTRVDDVVDEDILYLKVDVNGNEPAVFQGLTKLLTDKIILVILWQQSIIEKSEHIELPADYLKKLGYFISELHHGGAGNYFALHPRVGPILRASIMAMKEANIRDALAGHGRN